VFQVVLPARNHKNLANLTFCPESSDEEDRKETDGRNISYLRQLYLLLLSFDMST
jgi:hypothetical protein